MVLWSDLASNTTIDMLRTSKVTISQIRDISSLGQIYEKGYETRSKPLSMSMTKFRRSRVFGNFARL